MSLAAGDQASKHQETKEVSLEQVRSPTTPANNSILAGALHSGKRAACGAGGRSFSKKPAGVAWASVASRGLFAFGNVKVMASERKVSKGGKEFSMVEVCKQADGSSQQIFEMPWPPSALLERMKPGRGRTKLGNLLCY